MELQLYKADGRKLHEGETQTLKRNGLQVRPTNGKGGEEPPMPRESIPGVAAFIRRTGLPCVPNKPCLCREQ